LGSHIGFTEDLSGRERNTYRLLYSYRCFEGQYRHLRQGQTVVDFLDGLTLKMKAMRTDTRMYLFINRYGVIFQTNRVLRSKLRCGQTLSVVQ